MDLQPVVDMFDKIWNSGLNVIVIFVLFNLVIAVAAAIKTKTFNLSKLAGFMTEKILPYTIVYIAALIAGEGLGMSALAPLAWTALMAALLGDLLDSLNTLGLPLPDAIKNIVVKPVK